MKKIIIFTVLLVLTSVITSFSQTNSARKTLKGTTQSRVKAGEVFRNTSIGFSIALPEKWLKLSTKKTVESTKKSKETDKTLTNTGKRQFDEAINKTEMFFSLSLKSFGSAGNASFIAGVENVPSPKEVTTRQIILSSQRNFVKNLGYEVAAPIKRVVLDGKSFYMMSLYKKNVNNEFWQNIYFLKLDNSRVFQFAATYVFEEDLHIIKKAISTLRFSK